MIRSKVLFCFVCRKNKVHVFIGKKHHGFIDASPYTKQRAVCLNCGHEREFVKKGGKK